MNAIHTLVIALLTRHLEADDDTDEDDDDEDNDLIDDDDEDDEDDFDDDDEEPEPWQVGSTIDGPGVPRTGYPRVRIP
jgi:hypothetical protein